MKRTQKIQLIDADKHFVTAKVEQNYAVVFMESDDFIWLLETDGQYKIQRIDTVDVFPKTGSPSFLLRDENFAACCNGTRLVIATVQLSGDVRRASDCMLQVFEPDGLVYAGLYENSLQGDMLNHDMEESWLERPVSVSFVQ